MRIQHNIPAMSSYRNYTNNNKALASNLEKLSSGYKINRAGDDAAGLAISEKMRAQITGLSAAQKNVKDGTSLVKTAEGAMQEIHDMLNRMDYLATQSANGTYDNAVDRANLQKEVESLKAEINRIADSANFNGINLLDGKSGMGRLSELPVEYDTISTTKGVTIDNVADGGGSKGTYTFTINEKFSWGDAFTITANDGTNDVAATVTMAQNQTGDYFKGDTAEEQAASIANVLTSKFGGFMDVKTDGNKIVMTAKAEGTDKVGKIDSFKITTDTTVSAATFAEDPNVDGTWVKGAASAATAASAGTVTQSEATLNLIGNGTTPPTDGTAVAGNISEGDTLTFAFTNAAGKLMTTTFKATGDMASNDAKKSMDAIVDYLKNDAYFDDNDVDKKEAVAFGTTKLDRENTTGIDESKIKVSDMFDVAVGTTAGMITINAKAGGGVTVAADFKGMIIDHEGTKTAVSATVSQASANSTSAAQTFDVKLNTNFTAGEKLKYEGTLADGRKFEVELEAGKDFAIGEKNGSEIKDTLENIKNALVSDKTTVTLKDTSGKVVGELKGSELFTTETDDSKVKAEFKVASTADTLNITSARKGTADTKMASQIDKATITEIPDAKMALEKAPGAAQTSAQSTVTLDKELGYGAAIKVGDHTYEIVADAGDTSSRRNTAVVVKDPTDSEAVAKELAKAIRGNEENYDVSVAGSTVTVSSKEIGSDQKALAVSLPYGDKVTTASFKFDPKAVKEGSKLEFMDQTYQFVAKGGKTTVDGAIAIEVDNFKTATAKTLGNAFADVVKGGSVSVADDGTVTLKGPEAEDGTISDPVVRFDNNLVLQIGDTAADYNQLTVKLSDMHTTAMGINGIDISTQEGAQAAIDVIKDAINYVSGVRGDFGAIQNRLDHTANNLSVMAENIQDAESTIRDTDVAEEMMSYVKNNILVQSAQAMLAQANQLPQGVLQLLG